MLLIIYNNSAGKGTARKIIEDLCVALDRMGAAYRTVEKSRFSRAEAVGIFEAQKISHVIICGGDGTINRSVNDLDAYLEEIKIGVIPSGYGNLIAKALQSTSSLEDFLAGEGRAGKKDVKVGKANDRFFLNVVSVGSTADTVAVVEKFRHTLPGSVIYRVFGGIITHMFFFLLIQLKIITYGRKIDYPTSRAWMRTGGNASKSAFSIFSNIRDTIGQYKFLYLPGTRFIPWSISCAPVTSDEYQVEHNDPFYWQIDGEPQEKTTSLKISFACRHLNIQTLTQDRD
ncbi:diacylglycerol kinase family protein [Balneolales bacterium ANBcel1]|nr:diacylglycerol kinase family protein [Balneolales bacterium ANBcel1]